MPLDYSKWDNLELSDDSDVEVHPNVDKRSFIRAKQNQIHQDRAQRKHQIETFKYERLINDGLIRRIDALLDRLKAHATDAASADADPDQLVFRSLIESTGDPKDDQPPPRPEGVHAQVAEQPTYSKMMATLVDQVKTAVDEQKPANRMEAFIKEVQGHKDKVVDLQSQLHTHLGDLEKQESTKITSDSIKFGFNSSHVAKAAAEAPKSSSGAPTASSVELLNPGAGSSSKLEIPDPVEEDPDFAPGRTITPSALGRRFAKLPKGDYRGYLEFISKNPAVLAERETDGLLIDAYDKLVAGQEDTARQFVHQARLLQYCRQLGKDGVGLFFKRITTPDHNGRQLFFDDINDTFAKLRDSAKKAAMEADQEDNGEREQIQLHPVNPNQQIVVHVPSKDDPAEAENRKLFDAFTPALQKALESGELDEVNKVIGAMRVAEAEEIVEHLSNGGMLSMEEGVFDATTEEGRRAVEEYERINKSRPAPQAGSIEEVDEPEKKAVDELD